MSAEPRPARFLLLLIAACAALATYATTSAQTPTASPTPTKAPPASTAARPPTPTAPTPKSTSTPTPVAPTPTASPSPSPTADASLNSYVDQCTGTSVALTVPQVVVSEKTDEADGRVALTISIRPPTATGKGTALRVAGNAEDTRVVLEGAVPASLTRTFEVTNGPGSRASLTYQVGVRDGDAPALTLSQVTGQCGS